jgi:dTDP-4-amino-4,6-dideoxygalactose transaminase
MKTRNSKIFGDLEESECSNKLEIITKLAEKWILIDTENYFSKAISLPMYPTLSNEEQDFVIEQVNQFVNG